VSVTVAAGNGSATVAIRDSGIGFDTAFAQRLFEPFVQHEPAREQSSGGLGLGLAIASRLATLLGGSLKAMSPGIGMGAVFTLTMPVVARLNDISIDDSVAKPLIPRIILIVEDNQDLAQGMAELLRLSGASVHIAADGASAIARARETVPDVIVCDLGLPGGMDGYAVARACKADPRLKNVRLVAVSGYGSSGNRAQTLTAGFDAFLVKPLTEDSLRALAQ
jgi:CheY-like chemotaxis protein